MTEYKFSQTVANILGVDYTFEFKTEKEDSTLAIYNGFCDKFAKKIVIRMFEEDEINDNFTENLLGMFNNTLTHEIIHAFVQESGMNWSEISEEDICYWLSVHLEKINKVFEKVKIIEYSKEV